MSKKYIINSIEGARGHFLSEFLFNPDAVVAVECNHMPWPHLVTQHLTGNEPVDQNTNYVTHLGQLKNLKAICPNHTIIQVQVRDYWATAFLQWTKVGPWYMKEIKKLESFTDQVFQYMTEIKILHQQWQTHTKEQEYADYCVNFDMFDNLDYMSAVYQKINGYEPSSNPLNFLQEYFRLQPKFDSDTLDLTDPINTALILSRYEIQHQPEYFPFAIDQLEHGLDPLDYVSREQLGITDIRYRFFQ